VLRMAGLLMRSVSNAVIPLFHEWWQLLVGSWLEDLPVIVVLVFGFPGR
jgi:hypothetical protein